MTDRELLEYAIDIKSRAYVPYSSFPVGAALLTKEGRIFLGCNVENAAYGCCICAEQTAVVKAVSEGYMRFRAIAIAANSDDYCVPCGTCRQILMEFSPDMEVLCANKNGAYVSYKLSDMLAPAFRLEH